MKKLCLLIGVVVVVGLISACAYSPQQITINPKIVAEGDVYGGGRALVVSVEDARINKELGSRGGVYKETSLITIANDLSAALERSAKAKLATQGFNVNSDQSDAAGVKVIIEALSYDTPEQQVGKVIKLSAILRVEATAGGETYSGRYRSNSERQTVVTPTMARNERMINALLSDTLVRMFSDPKLKAFLSNI